MNRKDGKREILLALAFFALTAGVLRPTPAAAADAGAVIKACDNTPGCNYSQNKKNGDISGCSVNSGTCFYCPADGKHSCFQVRKRGKPGVRGATIGGVKLAPAPRRYRHRMNIGGRPNAKATYRHRSTGPTNPNGPGGSTGPFAPPQHRHTNSGGNNSNPAPHRASKQHLRFQHSESGKH